MLFEAPIEFKYKPFRFDDDEFYDFCLQNDELKFERDENGNIYIMPNTGGETGRLNSKLIQKISNWNDILETGEVFDSSTAFKLPSTSVRSPDVSWISNERWNALSKIQRKKFPPICPDFVIELMSESYNEKDVKKKMREEWMQNGCRLGWLINPHEKKVIIYRENADEEITDFENPLHGENVLPGFILSLDFLQN